MNFDCIAPWYAWMERWLAGGGMQKCRIAFLDHIPIPKSALLIGEGPGRFLKVFRQKFPDTRITVIDDSRTMLDIATREADGDDRIEFVKGRIETWETDCRFDLVVTNFVLDCFDETDLPGAIERISSLAERGADWLIADFSIPQRGFAKWRAQLIVRLLYLFFNITAGVRTSNLAPTEDLLKKQGFEICRSREVSWGLMKSQWWSRPSR